MEIYIINAAKLRTAFKNNLLNVNYETLHVTRNMKLMGWYSNISYISFFSKHIWQGY